MITYRKEADLAKYVNKWRNESRKRKRQEWKRNEKQIDRLYNFSFSTQPHWVSLLIIIALAAILCVPKEITLIQQEVSHLSFLTCRPECINPAAVRMAALHLSGFMHITGGCHCIQ